LVDYNQHIYNNRHEKEEGEEYKHTKGLAHTNPTQKSLNLDHITVPSRGSKPLGKSNEEPKKIRVEKQSKQEQLTTHNEYQLKKDNNVGTQSTKDGIPQPENPPLGSPHKIIQSTQRRLKTETKPIQ
jgi:hypothetical protein